jgi:hypothetical protein
MANTVRPIPEGYHTATPYLICNGAADAIEFYKRALGGGSHADGNAGWEARPRRN